MVTSRWPSQPQPLWAFPLVTRCISFSLDSHSRSQVGVFCWHWEGHQGSPTCTVELPIARTLCTGHQLLITGPDKPEVKTYLQGHEKITNVLQNRFSPFGASAFLAGQPMVGGCDVPLTLLLFNSHRLCPHSFCPGVLWAHMQGMQAPAGLWFWSSSFGLVERSSSRCWAKAVSSNSPLPSAQLQGAVGPTQGLSWGHGHEEGAGVIQHWRFPASPSAFPDWSFK